MNKNLLLILSSTTLLIVAVASFNFSNTQSVQTDRETERAKYEKFLNEHKFSQIRHTQEEIKEMDKRDRPDLAWEQDYLATMNPSLRRPEKEKLSPVLAMTKAMQQTIIPAAPGNAGSPWIERGPNNVGGRTRALTWDPTTTNKVWAGSVTGGLWFNNNITSAASTWQPVNDFWDNIAVTAIAFDPTNSNTMYIGTGEGWGAAASRGAGIWKSTNGGSSFTQLASTTDFYYINDLVVRNEGGAGVVYAAVAVKSYEGQFHGGSEGLQRSANGGISWAQMLPNVSGNPEAPTDIDIAADNSIWVGVDANSFGAGGGKIYSTTPAGTTFTLRHNHGSSGRVNLACAPSDADYVYAAFEVGGAMNAFKKSTNGLTFSAAGLTEPNDGDNGIPATDFTRGQAWYDLTLDVDPNNRENVIIGGIDLFKTLDGGATWPQISKWSNNPGLGTLPISLVHADQHTVVYKPGSSSEIIFGNDGGVFYSSNGNAPLTNDIDIDSRINGYNVTQYYACAIHPTAGTNEFLAGAQDNGTQRYVSAGMNSTTEATGGDGGFCFIDQTNAQFQFTSYVRNSWRRSTNSGTSFSNIQNDQGTGSFINPGDYDNNQDILYSARTTSTIQRINSATGAINIDNFTIAGLGSMASHLSVSPHTTTSTTLFVGTGAGKVFRVTNAQGGAPASTDITRNLPVGSISCIAIGGSNDTLLVTLSNYGVSSVWFTTDGAATNWTQKEGDLPDMPVRWALFNPNDYTEVILATEVGVWTTTNLNAGSPNWTTSNSGLANVRVDMLQMRSSDNEVIAATHGRGLFSSDGFNGPTVFTADFSANNVTPTINSTVTFTDLSAPLPTGWTWSFSPNTVTYQGGTNANSQNPQVSFNNPGAYTVTLAATDGTTPDSEIKTSYINVADFVADFSASNIAPTTAETVTLTDATTTAATGWTWTFAPATVTYQGGTTANSQNPQVTFDNAGVYTVTLVATDANNNDTEIKTNYINATVGYCTASATNTTFEHITNVTFGTINNTTVSSGYADYTVTPTPTQTTTLTKGSSYPFNITYTGTYTTDEVRVWIDFNQDNLFTPATEEFTVAPGGSGALSPHSVAILVPAGAVTGPTTMRVRLHDTGALPQPLPCGDSGYGEVEDYTVTIEPIPFVADFSADNVTPTINNTVTFTDLSNLVPTGWTWSFSPTTVTYQGGTNANSQNPQVSFDNPGAYTVTLVATDGTSPDTEIKTSYINVADFVADFSASNTAPSTVETVTFTDATTASATGWTWTFAPATVTYQGGTNANSQNPQVTFDNAGAYTATLVATDANNNDTEIKTNYINANIGYCTASSTSTAFEHITNVTFGTINNTTVSDGYTEYAPTPTTTTILTRGEPIPYNFNITYTNVYATNEVKVWIDFNQNFTFEASEEFTFPAGAGTGSPYTLPIAIPLSALPGQTRMRVRLHDPAFNPQALPCGDSGSGEVEDYTVTIEDPSYCDASSTNTTFEHITNVTFGSINNTTGSSGYADYATTPTPTTTTNLSKGTSPNFNVTYSNAYPSDEVRVWIDFNQNFIFDAASEEFVFPQGAGTGSPYTLAIPIPLTALTGSTRMRVRLHDTGALPQTLPCGDSGYGEVEDYTVEILPPSLITWLTQPANTTIECDASSLPTNTGTPTASTTCVAAGLTITSADVTVAGSCANESVITRTWTATDNCSNSETFDQVITIEDNTDPVITCPANQAQNAPNGVNTTLTDYTTMATISDNCSSNANTTVMQLPLAGSTQNVGTINVTLTATDECGNNASCNFDVVITNTSSISWTNQPANTTIECDASNLPANTGSATATSTCLTGVTVTSSDATVAGSCANESVITRTWTATDLCGNTETFDQVITIEDNTDPVINCPANQSQNATNGVNATLNDYITMATFSDNCTSNANMTVTQSPAAGSTQNVGIINITLTATDECGNNASCSFNDTIINTSSISWTNQPANTTIECDASNLPANTGSATATTTCANAGLNITSSDVTAAGICANESIITRTWTATDNCGNSETFDQVITIEDNTDPVITCPANQSEFAANGINAVLSDYTSLATISDNCSNNTNITVTQLPASGTTQNVGTVNVTLTATDECGNNTSCSFDVNVTTSSITWTNEPTNTTIECDISSLPASTGDATATSNCPSGGLAITYSDVTVAGSCVNESVITRTWTATDNCSNIETFDQIITIEDNTAPTISCPADQFQFASNGTDTVLLDYTSMATISDNCSSNANITVTQSPSAGSTQAIGTVNITLTATDECGNIDSCSFNLDINTTNVGISDNTRVNITIFPNPNKGLFTIDLGTEMNGEVIIQVYNLLGAVVYNESKENANSAYKLDLQHVEKGIYYVSVKGEQKTIIKKIMIM